MATVLLIIIYIAFIALGLPDSIIGASWPEVHQSLGLPLSAQGVVFFIVILITVFSSLFASRAVNKFGTAKVTAVSVLLTAVGLYAIAFSNAFIVICVMSIPLGIGAGAIDAALNNYVAENYSEAQMNWLHAFWGVGVAFSPIIYANALKSFGEWQAGFLAIAIIQTVIVVILFATLPLWKKVKTHQTISEENKEKVFISNRQALKRNGVIFSVLAFFFYCSVEFIVGNWGASYLVGMYAMSTAQGAELISLYYIGITVGRILSGFFALKLSYKSLIKCGTVLLVCGIICMMLNGKTTAIVGLFLIGFGCAPIFPSMIGLTPSRFGTSYSQTVIGLQMACAYVSGSIISPVFGVVADKISIGLMPYVCMAFVILFICAYNMTNIKARNKEI